MWSFIFDGKLQGMNSDTNTQNGKNMDPLAWLMYRIYGVFFAGRRLRNYNYKIFL